MLRKVLDSGAWREFHTPTGKPVAHPTFESFVTDGGWRGLGITKQVLLAWVGPFDEQLAADIETAWKASVPAAPAHGEVGRGRDRESGTHSISERRDADSILARLKRDDPALAEQVIAGDLTANAAALRKGWRKPRVLLTAPNSVAAQVRKHFTDDEIRDLITELEALL